MTNLSSPASSSLVKIGKDISVGKGQPLLLIAGPCQIESLDHCLKTAEFLQNSADPPCCNAPEPGSSAVLMPK